MGGNQRVSKAPTTRPECLFCGRLFSAPRYLEDHMNTHTGEKPYQCDKCDRSFGQSKSLWEHNKVFHLGHRWKCQYCTKEFTSTSSFSAHKKAVHAAEEEESRRRREQEPGVSSAINTAVWKAISVQSPQTEDKQGIKLKLKLDLTPPTRIINNKTDYVEDEVPKKKVKLAKQKRKVKEKRIWKCEVCGKVFFRHDNYSLKRHLSTVHKDLSFPSTPPTAKLYLPAPSRSEEVVAHNNEPTPNIYQPSTSPSSSQVSLLNKTDEESNVEEMPTSIVEDIGGLQNKKRPKKRKEKRIWKCMICGKQFYCVGSYSLRKHINIDHFNESESTRGTSVLLEDSVSPPPPPQPDPQLLPEVKSSQEEEEKLNSEQMQNLASGLQENKTEDDSLFVSIEKKEGNRFRLWVCKFCGKRFHCKSRFNLARHIQSVHANNSGHLKKKQKAESATRPKVIPSRIKSSLKNKTKKRTGGKLVSSKVVKKSTLKNVSGGGCHICGRVFSRVDQYTVNRHIQRVHRDLLEVVEDEEEHVVEANINSASSSREQDKEETFVDSEHSTCDFLTEEEEEIEQVDSSTATTPQDPPVDFNFHPPYKLFDIPTAQPSEKSWDPSFFLHMNRYKPDNGDGSSCIATTSSSAILPASPPDVSMEDETKGSRRTQDIEDMDSYQCPKCGRVLANKTSFKRHLNLENCLALKHIKENPVSALRYICPFCGKNFNDRRGNLVRHIASVHRFAQEDQDQQVSMGGGRRKKDYSCAFCELTSQFKDEIKEHILETHVHLLGTPKEGGEDGTHNEFSQESCVPADLDFGNLTNLEQLEHDESQGEIFQSHEPDMATASDNLLTSVPSTTLPKRPAAVDQLPGLVPSSSPVAPATTSGSCDEEVAPDTVNEIVQASTTPASTEEPTDNNSMLPQTTNQSSLSSDSATSFEANVPTSLPCPPATQQSLPVSQAIFVDLETSQEGSMSSSSSSAGSSLIEVAGEGPLSSPVISECESVLFTEEIDKSPLSTPHEDVMKTTERTSSPLPILPVPIDEAPAATEDSFDTRKMPSSSSSPPVSPSNRLPSPVSLSLQNTNVQSSQSLSYPVTSTNKESPITTSFQQLVTSQLEPTTISSLQLLPCVVDEKPSKIPASTCSIAIYESQPIMQPLSSPPRFTIQAEKEGKTSPTAACVDEVDDEPLSVDGKDEEDTQLITQLVDSQSSTQEIESTMTTALPSQESMDLPIPPAAIVALRLESEKGYETPSNSTSDSDITEPPSLSSVICESEGETVEDDALSPAIPEIHAAGVKTSMLSYFSNNEFPVKTLTSSPRKNEEPADQPYERSEKTLTYLFSHTSSSQAEEETHSQPLVAFNVERIGSTCPVPVTYNASEDVELSDSTTPVISLVQRESSSVTFETEVETIIEALLPLVSGFQFPADAKLSDALITAPIFPNSLTQTEAIVIAPDHCVVHPPAPAVVAFEMANIHPSSQMNNLEAMEDQVETKEETDIMVTAQQTSSSPTIITNTVEDMSAPSHLVVPSNNEMLETLSENSPASFIKHTSETSSLPLLNRIEMEEVEEKFSPLLTPDETEKEEDTSSPLFISNEVEMVEVEKPLLSLDKKEVVESTLSSLLAPKETEEVEDTSSPVLNPDESEVEKETSLLPLLAPKETEVMEDKLLPVLNPDESEMMEDKLLPLLTPDETEVVQDASSSLLTSKETEVVEENSLLILVPNETEVVERISPLLTSNKTEFVHETLSPSHTPDETKMEEDTSSSLQNRNEIEVVEVKLPHLLTPDESEVEKETSSSVLTLNEMVENVASPLFTLDEADKVKSSPLLAHDETEMDKSSPLLIPNDAEVIIEETLSPLIIPNKSEFVEETLSVSIAPDKTEVQEVASSSLLTRNEMEVVENIASSLLVLKETEGVGDTPSSLLTPNDTEVIEEKLLPLLTHDETEMEEDTLSPLVIPNKTEFVKESLSPSISLDKTDVEADLSSPLRTPDETEVEADLSSSRLTFKEMEVVEDTSTSLLTPNVPEVIEEKLLSPEETKMVEDTSSPLLYGKEMEVVEIITSPLLTNDETEEDTLSPLVIPNKTEFVKSLSPSISFDKTEVEEDLSSSVLSLKEMEVVEDTSSSLISPNDTKVIEEKLLPLHTPDETKMEEDTSSPLKYSKEMEVVESITSSLLTHDETDMKENTLSPFVIPNKTVLVEETFPPSISLDKTEVEEDLSSSVLTLKETELVEDTSSSLLASKETEAVGDTSSPVLTPDKSEMIKGMSSPLFNLDETAKETSSSPLITPDETEVEEETLPPFAIPNKTDVAEDKSSSVLNPGGSEMLQETLSPLLTLNETDVAEDKSSPVVNPEGSEMVEETPSPLPTPDETEVVKDKLSPLPISEETEMEEDTSSPLFISNEVEMVEEKPLLSPDETEVVGVKSSTLHTPDETENEENSSSPLFISNEVEMVEEKPLLIPDETEGVQDASSSLFISKETQVVEENSLLVLVPNEEEIINETSSSLVTVKDTEIVEVTATSLLTPNKTEVVEDTSLPSPLLCPDETEVLEGTSSPSPLLCPDESDMGEDTSLPFLNLNNELSLSPIPPTDSSVSNSPTPSEEDMPMSPCILVEVECILVEVETSEVVVASPPTSVNGESTQDSRSQSPITDNKEETEEYLSDDEYASENVASISEELALSPQSPVNQEETRVGSSSSRTPEVKMRIPSSNKGFNTTGLQQKGSLRYCCYICQRSFDNQYRLGRHLAGMHRYVNPAANPKLKGETTQKYSCVVCGGISSAIKNIIRQHISANHKELLMPIVVEDPPEDPAPPILERIEEVVIPVKQEEDEEDEDELAPPVLTPECAINNNWNPEESVMTIERCRCLFCSKKIARTDMIRHIASRHRYQKQGAATTNRGPAGSYFCMFCGKGSVGIQKLELHISNHHRELALSKNEDDVDDPEVDKDDKEIKTKVSSRECRKCRKRFRSVFRLKMHQRSARNCQQQVSALLTACKFCGKHFDVKRGHLLRHIVGIHCKKSQVECDGEEEKRQPLYSCVFCGENYMPVNALTQHIRTNHKPDIHK